MDTPTPPNYQDRGGSAVGDLYGKQPRIVAVAPVHTDVGGDAGGDDEEARVPGEDSGVVPHV